MSNLKRPAQYIYTGYNQSVYTLLWSDALLPDEESSPAKTIDTNKKVANYFYLYSVSDGKIMRHQMLFVGGSGGTIVSADVQTKNFYKELVTQTEKDADADADKTEESIVTNKSSKVNYEYGLTEFSVLKIESPSSSSNDEKRSDYFVAIGKFDGSTEIYRSFVREKKIRRLCTFFNHQKLVTCLKWNRNVYQLEQTSPDVYLASGSNDFNVIIIDFKSLISEFDANKLKEDTKLFSKYKHRLVGHKERITGLSWSTNSAKENLLASCSYDSTVQVWNAESGCPIANYRGHSDKLLCCTFSNSDSNVVYSGGEDYCLHKWKIDAQTEKTPPEECKKKIFILKFTLGISESL